MSKQHQSVGVDGEAYQAGGNITIYNGPSAEDMADIMIALSAKLHSYVAEAKVEAEKRLADFREAIVKEFTSPTTIGNRAAFSDPDYQFLLQDAQQSYARSGEERLCAELVKLLTQRSVERTGSRPAFLLNQAILISNRLTCQDYAVLCCIFYFRYCGFASYDPASISASLRNVIESFIDDLPDDTHALDYLGSLGLVNINEAMLFPLENQLHNLYASAYSTRFSEQELEEALAGLEDVGQIGPLLRFFKPLQMFSQHSGSQFATWMSFKMP